MNFDDYLQCSAYENQTAHATAPNFASFFDAKSKRYFFALLSDSGKTLLKSEGYTQEKTRENGIKSVQKNKIVREHFSLKTNLDQYYVSLRAGNHQEIARSCEFATETEAKNVIAQIFGEVSNAKTPSKKVATPKVEKKVTKVVAPKVTKVATPKVEKKVTKVVAPKVTKVTASKVEKTVTKVVAPKVIKVAAPKVEKTVTKIIMPKVTKVVPPKVKKTVTKVETPKVVKTVVSKVEKIVPKITTKVIESKPSKTTKITAKTTIPTETTYSQSVYTPSSETEKKTIYTKSTTVISAAKIGKQYLDCTAYLGHETLADEYGQTGYAVFTDTEGKYYFSVYNPDTSIYLRSEAFATVTERNHELSAVKNNIIDADKYQVREEGDGFMVVLLDENNEEIARSCTYETFTQAYATTPKGRTFTTGVELY
jgi:uncharacterized protein YegP (UPF0339 family)